MSGLKVFKEPCKNCLLSKDRIVSAERVKSIIKKCAKDQTHFLCHKASDTVCNTFFNKFGHLSQMIRVSERLNMVEFIEQPAEAEKLTPYDERKKVKV